MALDTGPSKSFGQKMKGALPGLTNSLAQQFGAPKMSGAVKAAGSALPMINKKKQQNQQKKSIGNRMQPYPKAPAMQSSTGFGMPSSMPTSPMSSNTGPAMGAGSMSSLGGMPTGASQGARPYAYSPMLNNTMPVSSPVPLGGMSGMNMTGGGMGMGDSMTGSDATVVGPSFSQFPTLGGEMNPSMGGGGLWERYRNLTQPQMQQPQGQLFY